jgi:predicted DNA binding CopG/RHH family protein
MARRSKSSSAEAALSAWYASPEGRRQTQREFERALKRGAVLPSEGARITLSNAKTLAELVAQAKAKATKAISLRVPVADIEQAQAIAEREGVGYQTILKKAIRAGLKKVS